MIVSSASRVHHVSPVVFGLPVTAARGPGPARLLSVLFESRWSPKQAIGRAELRNHLASMVVNPRHQRQVADDLEPLGWGMVSWLRRFGVKVKVSKEVALGPHGPRWGGIYRPHYRSVTLKRGWQPSTALHEMAHALDHSLAAASGVRSVAHNPSIAPMLWHGFASERQGFVSDYAATNPREYFAESFAAIFDDKKAQRLAWIDPGMHAFTSALVDLSNIF